MEHNNMPNSPTPASTGGNSMKIAALMSSGNGGESSPQIQNNSKAKPIPPNTEPPSWSRDFEASSSTADLPVASTQKEVEAPNGAEGATAVIASKTADIKSTPGTNKNGESLEKETLSLAHWKDDILGRPLLLSIGEFNYEDFKNRWGWDARYHIIELLMASDRTTEQEEREIRRQDMRSPWKRHKFKEQKSLNEVWIQRIRIHSPIILHYMGIVMQNATWVGSRPRVFFKPFKALIYYHSHMKNASRALEEKFPAEKGPTNKEEEGQDLTNSTDHESVTALKHMRSYIDFMETRILPMENMFSETSERMVRFDELWFLFKVGDVLHVPKGPVNTKKAKGRYQTAFRLCAKTISTVADDKPDDLGKNSLFRLACYYLDYDGAAYMPVITSFSINTYSGRKDVRELVAYPVRFHVNVEKLQDDWALQGQKFRSLTREKHVAADGWTMTAPPAGLDEDSDQELPEHIESDVIIDAGEALKKHPSWKLNFENDLANQCAGTWMIGDDDTTLCHWPNPNKDEEYLQPAFELDEITQRDDDAEKHLLEDFAETDAFAKACASGTVESLDGLDEDINGLLLPSRVFVYVLRQRKFVMLNIFAISRIPTQSTIFDDLKIENDHKLIVQSLVHRHFENQRLQKQRSAIRSTGQDLVRGKGAGLFILLHGVPGVGKTATAEAVAQANNKPLFPITCGDLGLTPEAVDSKLNDVFRLAHLWDCVLLLDEADIFLARRDTFNLKRNAMVSVFLRVLEYYSGILFLTTNRVGILDEAFKSRIHISLYYEPLTRQQTVDIFRVNIQKLRDIEDEKQRLLQGTDVVQPKLRVMAKGIVEYAARYFDEQEAAPHLRWNGRQIRNAFQIASSLAYYHKRKSSLGNEEYDEGTPLALDVTHFEKVAEAIERFGKYMDLTKAMTDADQARLDTIRADGIRNDDLTPKKREYRASSSAQAQNITQYRTRSEATHKQSGPSSFGRAPVPPVPNVNLGGLGRGGRKLPLGRNIGQAPGSPARRAGVRGDSPASGPPTSSRDRSTSSMRTRNVANRHAQPQYPSQPGIDDEQALGTYDEVNEYYEGRFSEYGQNETLEEDEDYDDLDPVQEQERRVAGNPIDRGDYDDYDDSQ